MSTSERVRAGRAEILLLVCVLIWAANFPVAKYGIAGLDIFVFNSIRYLVAAASLMVLFLARSTWKPVDRSDWSSIFRAGLVANVLYQLAFIIGLSMTTAGNSAVLLATAPLWTVFLNACMHKEKILLPLWLGMAFSLCGVAIIIIGSGKKLELGSNALAGDIITLAAAILWALSTNLQKPLLTRYSPLQVTLMMIGVGAIGLSVVAIPPAAALAWGSIHFTYYLAAVASGTLSIAAANAFWSFGVKRLGPGRTATFGNLVPVLALVISYFALHEEPAGIQFVGSAVTILGVWLARR